ncbi:MAG: hypothetical protein WDN31_13600 [Hyphomicrobium sp.]
MGARATSRGNVRMPATSSLSNFMITSPATMPALGGWTVGRDGSDERT